MKDLYSFHRSVEDLDNFYEKAKQAYLNVFERCGLNVEVVEASGSVFSKFSHEFQVMTEYGEDDVYYCVKCHRHQNKELVADGELKCPYCGEKREIKKSIEVGNIFRLLTRFSDPFEFVFKDEDGRDKPVVMGCYGIGPSRVLGSVVEIHHDKDGMIWPESIAPFQIHLISLCKDEENIKRADEIYEILTKQDKEVLYDNRVDMTAGQKFSDADLIGIPLRYVVSAKTLEKDSVEIKKRGEEESKLEKISV
jgi:prolyl-tRNA synthetase